MNFLAHLHLSGSDPEIVIGNFIGDFVRGSESGRYAPGIQRGIELHRHIDTFTDTHPVVTESKERLHPVFHKYAPVVCDIYYDHILARDWEQYAEEPLRDFATRLSDFLQQHGDQFPQRAQRFLQYMCRYDILYNYGNLEGIAQVFEGMVRRSSFESGMEQAADFLSQERVSIAEDFHRFYPDLQQSVREFLSTAHP